MPATDSKKRWPQVRASCRPRMLTALGAARVLLVVWAGSLAAQTQTAVGPTAVGSLASVQESIASVAPRSALERVERLDSLSGIYARQGNAPTAIFWAKQAMLAAQDTTQGAASGAGAATRCQDRLAALLLEAGRIDEAQQVLQLAKECELHQSLGGSLSVDPRITPVPLSRTERDLAEVSAQLDREWESLTQAREALAAKTSPTEPAARAELAAIGSRLNAVEQRKQDLFATVERRVSGVDRAVTSASRLQLAVRALAEAEPAAQAVGLQYLVQEEGVWILLLRDRAPPWRTFVAVPKAQLGQTVQVLRLQMRDPASDLHQVQAHLARLYDWLVAPVEAELVQAKTLMVSATGPLRHVPFAALRGPDGYLVERLAVASFNEAIEQNLASGTPPRWRITAMGMSQSVEKLRALVAVREETRGVIQQPNTQGIVYLDREFSLGRLKRVLDARGPASNVLHIASHFVLEPRHAADSRLYLGDGSRLSLVDLSTSRLRFDQFDLLTLSACETAAPGLTDLSTGQEIESLGAYAQQQGAKAVVATLWKVNDRSTAAFMQDFYRQRGTRQSDKASALRETQLAFLRRGTEARDAPANWAHPFYWAPFVLMGNWR